MNRMERTNPAGASGYRVRALIREIRARWRRRAVLQGAALTAFVFVVWGAALLLLLRLDGMPPAGILVGAAIGLIVVAGFAVVYVVRPASRRISDQQIALFVEERFPDFEDRLNSAVELESGTATDTTSGRGAAAGLREERTGGGLEAAAADSPDRRAARSALIDRLIDDASERARLLPLTSVVDRKRERLMTSAGAVALLLFGLLLASSLDELDAAFGNARLATLIPASQPAMSVEPGNAEIEQGASQEIIVTLREETDRSVELHYRQGEGAWTKASMRAAIGEPAFMHEFLDVQEPLEYFVSHDDDRSAVYEISLYEFPDVVQIDQTITYPAYTGLAARREENRGDVHGLVGSTVTLDVQTTGRLTDAELVIDGEQIVRLEDVGEGRFRGSFALQDEGYYTVRLTDAASKQNRFPKEYRIVPVADEKPYVAVTDPQRDVRANSVEEVLVAARAQDDIRLKSLRLRYALNGGEEQIVELASPTAPEAEGEHLFFLEDFDVAPGDVISYYVEAEDHLHDKPAATDMYFIEVIPFDRDYSQAAAGGMQGGGQASGIVLSQQQIIAATWKLYRESDDLPANEVESARRGLVQAQENLRRNIEERINTTAFSLEMNENTRAIAEHLRTAVRAMSEAVKELEAERLREALVPEREALNFLLKADALNKERQIALNRGSQGGSGSATEERMTELMDLELDIAKDKYETLPQESPGGGGGGEMDEALQKIRELARRQQNLENESRRALEGEDQRRMVERLQREQDELRRQTEDAARSLQQMARRQGQSGEATREQLDRVAENMREAERALRRGNVQQARARQQQAVNDLERLSQDLRLAGNDDRRGELEALQRSFEQLKDREQELARELDRTMENARSQGVGRDDVERLAEQRRAQQETLQRLDEQAGALSGGSAESSELDAAARALRQSLRREALDEHMRASEESLRRGWLDQAQRRGEAIQDGLGRLEDDMRAFEDHLPLTDEERLARSLDQLRELERELRRLEQDMAGADGQPTADASRSARGGEAPGGREADASGREGDAEGRGGEPPSRDAAGSDSDTPGGAAEAGQAGGRSGGDASRAESAARQARIARARERLDRMQQDLGGTPAAQNVEQLRRALGRADHAGVSLEGESAAAFFNENVFAPLSALEAAIRNELDRVAMEKKLYGSRPGDVPDEYRNLVEKYYESLSKSSR